MKLLRKSLLLRPLRRLLAGRRAAARRAYAVTVPAPLAMPGDSNLLELPCRVPAPTTASSSARLVRVSGR